MKGMLVTADRDVFEVELACPFYESAGRLLGGNAEHIVPLRLDRPYCMIVNGEGAMGGLEKNSAGCCLLGTDEPGQTVCGDFLILKDVWISGGVEVAGLEDEDIASVTGILEDVFLEAECG